MQPTEESLKIARGILVSYENEVNPQFQSRYRGELNHRIALALDAAYQRGRDEGSNDTVGELQPAYDALEKRYEALLTEQPSGNPGELETQLEAMTALAAQRGEAYTGARKSLLKLRIHFHRIQQHNQHFERCESSICNPSPLNNTYAELNSEVDLETYPFTPGHLESFIALADPAPETWLAEKIMRAKAEGAAEELEAFRDELISVSPELGEIAVQFANGVTPAFNLRIEQIRKEAGL